MFGNNNGIWGIILVLIILYFLGFNWCGCNNGCGCNNDCGCNNNNCCG